MTVKAHQAILPLIHKPRKDTLRTKQVNEDEVIEYTNATACKTTFEPGKYRYIDISDSNLQSCALNTVTSYRSTNVRVTYTNCQLTGLQLPEGNFKHVTFTDCRVNLANFRNSTFGRCAFIRCDLSEADFAGSDIEFVLFGSCNLDRADISNCVMKNVEFVDCGMPTLKGVQSLRGTKISEQNLIQIAPQLAIDLDIRVQS